MELLNFEGQDVLDSRDVAKMIGKEHKNLMRDIRTYTKDIEESSKLSARIFFHSKYLSKQTGKDFTKLPPNQTGMRICSK